MRPTPGRRKLDRLSLKGHLESLIKKLRLILIQSRGRKEKTK